MVQRSLIMGKINGSKDGSLLVWIWVLKNISWNNNMHTYSSQILKSTDMSQSVKRKTIVMSYFKQSLLRLKMLPESKSKYVMISLLFLLFCSL